MEHRFLMTVGGIDNEHVGTCVEQCLRAPFNITVDAERRTDAQLALRVDSRLVKRRTQRALTRENTHQRAIGVQTRDSKNVRWKFML